MADPAHIITHHSAAQRLARAPLARFEISPHHTRRIIFCFNNIKLLNCETFFPFFFLPLPIFTEGKKKEERILRMRIPLPFLIFFILSIIYSILSIS